MSVYAEDATLDAHSVTDEFTDFEHVLSVIVRPRGAHDAASCFVEAHVKILLPATYPVSEFPTVTVTRVSGLNDEGKQFNDQIARFFQDQVAVVQGDDVLFPLMEEMLDYLDSVDDGECLICLSSLRAPPPGMVAATGTGRVGSTSIKSSDKSKGASKKPLALRTTCYHCYHVHCLTRWGATFLWDDHLKAEAGREHTTVGRADRAMQVGGCVKRCDERCEGRCDG